MKAIIPISLKRLAVLNMQKVQDGRIPLEDAETIIRKCTSRERAVESLTRNYDPATAEALKYFRLL